MDSPRLPPGAGLPAEGPVVSPDAPPTTTHTTSETISTVPTVAPGWLHANVRNIILLAVTAVVCYLAILGVAEVRSAVVATFTGLASYLFAERAALKVPGKDA